MAALSPDPDADSEILYRAARRPTSAALLSLNTTLPLTASTVRGWVLNSFGDRALGPYCRLRPD